MNQPIFQISLPGRFSENFGEPIAGIFKLIETLVSNGPHYDYILDYGDAKFTNPLFTIAIPLIAKMLSRDGYNISVLSNFKKTGVHDYMQLLKFPDGVNPEAITDVKYDYFLKQYSSKTYIPLINFPTSESANITLIRDEFLSAINSIIKEQTHISGNMRTAIMYLIDEAVNNIIHHSNDERGYILAQVYHGNGYMEIVIADIGRTLLQSYESSGRHKNVNSHLLALTAALNGKSTKSNNIDRGFGISTSKKMLTEGLNGKYFIYSGNVFNIHTSERNDIITLPLSTFWQGVYVAMRIPLVAKIGFNPSDYYE